MRIAFIAHRSPVPPNKGEKIRSFWQLRTLAKNHSIHLFCFYDDLDDEQCFDELEQYCANYYVEKLSYVGSRTRALLALLRGRAFSTAFFYSRRMARRIQAALKSGTYDRVFVSSSSMAQYVDADNGVVTIVDLVDVDSNKWQQYATRKPWPLGWLWRLESKRLAACESALVRQFAATLVCTDAEAHLLRSIAHEGVIRTVQNHIDVDQYDPAKVVVPRELQSWQPYMVFSGSMDYLPNVDAVGYFCRVIYPLIRQARPDAKLVIAGRNPHPSVRDLSKDPSIKVTGRVQDMTPYISAAAVSIAPMRIARGVQNKVLEALASGVPVVSTTAVASALPPNLRCLVRTGDAPHEFANHVIAALRDRSNRQSDYVRRQLKLYVEGLELGAQLENVIKQPAVNMSRVEPCANAMCGLPG